MNDFKQRPGWKAMAIGLLLTAMTAVASAQTTIDWWCVAGGGASSQLGNMELVGTVGQPTADQSGAGPVWVQSGFLVGFAPNAPNAAMTPWWCYE